MLAQLASVVPRRFGDTGGAWHLLFWSAMHGTSLSHLLRCAADAGPCLLLVRDTEQRVYGAYCTELREPRSGGQGDSLFYGDGETRLIALSHLSGSAGGLGGAGGASGASGAGGGGGAGGAGRAGGAGSAGAAAAYVAHAFEWSGRNRHFICGVGGATGPNPTVEQLVI